MHMRKQKILVKKRSRRSQRKEKKRRRKRVGVKRCFLKLLYFLYLKFSFFSLGNQIKETIYECVFVIWEHKKNAHKNSTLKIPNSCNGILEKNNIHN